MSIPLHLWYKGSSYPCQNREIICENGGLCRVQKGQPSCVCQNGYEGKYCQLTTISLEAQSENATGNANYV